MLPAPYVRTPSSRCVNVKDDRDTLAGRRRKIAYKNRGSSNISRDSGETLATRRWVGYAASVSASQLAWASNFNHLARAPIATQTGTPHQAGRPGPPNIKFGFVGRSGFGLPDLRVMVFVGRDSRRPMQGPMTMTKMTDIEHVERSIAVCVAFDLGAKLFAGLECDRALLHARDRALKSAALVDAIAREPDGDDWSCVPVSRKRRRRLLVAAD